MVVSKIRAISEYGTIDEAPYIETYTNEDMFSGYIVTLVNTETSERTTIKSVCLSNVIDRLKQLKPYGFVCRQDTLGNDRFQLIAMSKSALEFLSYVESVSIIHKEKCQVDLSDMSILDGVTVESCLDDFGSMLCVYLAMPDVNKAVVQGYCSLFDAIVMYSKSWHEDGFYLPAIVDAHMDEDGYVYRVECSDLASAKRLITKAKVLNADLHDKIYAHACGSV